MASQPKRKYTLEEYLALERESETKYEFWNGEVFAMSGGSFAHDEIMMNTSSIFSNQLSGKNCRVRSDTMQIKVPAAPPYRYADGSIVCGDAEIEQFNGCDLLINPLIIWEILSPSTEAYDRGDKFTFYQSIPSFREYLLIAQHRPHISQYFRQENGKWDYEQYNNLAETVELRSIDCAVALRDVYRDVKFP